MASLFDHIPRMTAEISPAAADLLAKVPEVGALRLEREEEPAGLELQRRALARLNWLVGQGCFELTRR